MSLLKLRKALLHLLVLGTTILLAAPAFACSVSDEFKLPTQEELRAKADLVVSGKLVDVIKDPARNSMRGNIQVAQYIRGTGPAVLPIKAALGSICGSASYEFLANDQRWTFYLNLRPKDSPYHVVSLETLCPVGIRPFKEGPVGLCQTTIDQTVTTGLLRMGRGSEVIFEANHPIEETIWSAKLAPESAFVDIPLPLGTIARPMGGRLNMDIPRPTIIGPIRIEGRINLLFFDTINRDTNVYHFRIGWPPEKGTPHSYHGQTGGPDAHWETAAIKPIEKLTVYGGTARSVSFKMPGPKLLEAEFDEPTLMNGYWVAGEVLFAPDGNIERFRSAKDQLIGDRLVRKCDSVELDHGKPVGGSFWNACDARR